jgi:DNA-binding GntR family transcriptional regulator
LSDQVYELLREDLKSGHFTPGQRLLEVELAEMYKVSRTPVREALFQLSREGLLAGNDRGYLTRVYTKADIMHRLEVKRLIDPSVATHVATEAEPQQIKAFGKAHERRKAAHATEKVKTFSLVSGEMRTIYQSMCKNELLVRCQQLVDDPFEIARIRIYENPENRELTIEHDERMLQAITARDPQKCAEEASAFLDFLYVYYDQHPPSDFA